jgi:hypothetical protein
METDCAALVHASAADVFWEGAFHMPPPLNFDLALRVVPTRVFVIFFNLKEIKKCILQKFSKAIR